ncbi:hemicentin-2-like isoform X1 [Ostrinia furnacalis]|uniref:hemicentin-2-like isoform X1 n=2 Tax=Ostrinia furnacalis TaxID=93504 RepID=UPI00103FD589|nr:hemicentin-2-like isoform X1 [Ostrinia furnacalis]
MYQKSSVIMTLNNLFYFVLVFIPLTTGEMEKGSLTFVIDNTQSMQRDIDQVKYGVELIFNAVTNSVESPVEDVILIAFNDLPTQVDMLTRTKDPFIFKAKLSGIIADGGDDCPESSMSGIKLGLKEGLPGSFLYVFTDDEAKDHDLLDDVQSLAIKKYTQVVFILTHNKCGRRSKTFNEYHKLANATSGAVFYMDKEYIKEILNLMEDTVKSRQTEILSKSLPPGYGHNVTIPIDSAMKDSRLTSIGTHPEITDLTAPDGSKPEVKTIVDIPSVTSIKVFNISMAGNYTATVGSESATKFICTATSKINFKYGFSPVEPTTMEDTVTLPIADAKSHISVQIFTEEAYVPSQIILTNDEGATIGNLPLKLINAKENIYITDKMVPQKGLFKIGVFGYHNESKTNITRVSNTFIEVQKISESPKSMSPDMEIDKGNEIKVKYNDAIKLVCTVEAYPKPEITWQDEDGIILPTEVLPFMLPYSYKAELEIDKVTMTKTYKCSAKNSEGDISRKIKVETERTQYLDILEEPVDTNVIYKNSAKINCKVDALPPATITWYGNGEILKTNEFFDVTDAEVLTIKKMMPYLIGSYSCKATNGLESKDLSFKLSLTGTKPSTSIMGPPKVNAKYNKPLFLRCQVEGYPKPDITWINEKTEVGIRSAPVEVPAPFDYGQETQMDRANENATYKCIAKNEFGEHSSSVIVVTIPKDYFDVEEAPKDTAIKFKEDGQVLCKVDAYPPAKIQWKFKGRPIEENDHYKISSDSTSLVIKDMQPDLVGAYFCRVDNKNHFENFKFEITISGTERPRIMKINNDVHIEEGSTLDIECRIIKGIPPPTYTWAFKPDGDVFGAMEETSNKIHLDEVSRYDSGEYVCTASNVAGDDKHHVYLTVEFPPTIEEEKGPVNSKKGDETSLNCKVEGFPTPEVVWSLNGAPLIDGGEYKIFRDNMLRFSASLLNNGVFKCKATNKYGTAEIEIKVEYYEEPEFVIPEYTSLNTYVGEKEKIRCEATGYPEPTLTWIFISSEDLAPGSKVKEVILRTVKSPDEYVFKRIRANQAGQYICLASNGKSEKRLLFEVDVKQPAYIITALSKPIKAVKGDIVRIPCQAEGKPKPIITWSTNGYEIPTGYDSYTLDTDGALIINGISERGSFVCKADNELSSPHEKVFQVDLEEYPRETKIFSTFNFNNGEAAVVTCPITRSLVDSVRWYKNSRKQDSEELKFDTITYLDAGVYTCRVSHISTMKSESASVQVTVK